MDKIGLIMLVSSSVTNALANSFLKIAFAGNTGLFANGLIAGLIKIFTNPYALLGAALFGVSFVFFGNALARVNLSLGYPFMSGLAFLLIFFSSILFFKETINIWGLIGVFNILFGIILISVKG